jgi:hypothetical protein
MQFCGETSSKAQFKETRGFVLNNILSRVPVEKMKLCALLLLTVASAAFFVAGRENGPVAFALLEHCQQYFKCTV